MEQERRAYEQQWNDPQWHQPQPQQQVYREDQLGNLINVQNINKRHPLQNLATLVSFGYFFITSTTLYALANSQYNWAVSNLGLWLVVNTQVFFGYMGLYAVVAYSALLTAYSFVVKHDSASRIMRFLIGGVIVSTLISGFSLLYGYDTGEVGQNLLGHMTVGFLIEFVFGEVGTHIVYWAVLLYIVVKIVESQTDWRLIHDIDRAIEDLKKKWTDSYKSFKEEIKALPRPELNFLKVKERSTEKTPLVNRTNDSLKANPPKTKISSPVVQQDKKEKQSIPTVEEKQSIPPVQAKVANPVKTEIPMPVQKQIEIMTARELASQHYEKPKMILDWLAEGELVMIHADQKTGKTRLALSLAYAIATGGEILGWQANVRKVLYVDGEMGRVGMSNRMKELNGELPEGLILYTYDMYPEFPNICRPEGQKLINAVIKNKRLVKGDVIFLDSYKLLGKEDGSKTSGYAIFEDWFLNLKKHGYTVILLHHNNKSGVQDGTGKKTMIINTTISLTLPKGYTPNGQESRFFLEFKDIRESHGCDLSPFEAVYRAGEYVWKRVDSDNDVKVRESSVPTPVTARESVPTPVTAKPTVKQVLTLAQQGFTQSEIASQLDISQGTVSKALNRFKLLQSKRSDNNE